jgi:hypothetical protein
LTLGFNLLAGRGFSTILRGATELDSRAFEKLE